MAILNNAYALIIGVGDDLPQSENDANKINNILTDESLAGYPEENVKLLTQKNASRTNILAAFDWLIREVDPESTVFLYYSGHGGHYPKQKEKEIDGVMTKLTKEVDGKIVPLMEERYFFQLYGMRQEMNYPQMQQHMFYSFELRERLNALNTNSLVFFLDCCHAEGMTMGNLEIGIKSDDETNSVEYNNLEWLAQKVDNEKGVSIISSCTKDQKSLIKGGADFSLFTTCMVDYITAKHDPNYNLPYIYISELTGYLQREVPRVAWETIEPPKKQNPYVNLQNYANFAICNAPEAVREKLSPEALNIESQPKSTEVNKPVISWRDEGTDNLILFLHGFSGEASDTFGEIPNMLMEEEDINGWDMRPLGYSQFVNPELGKEIWAGIYDIERIAEELSISIVFKFREYSRIAIVAHSLGGLVAQKAILKLKPNHRERISHLIMFGTPSNGIDASLLEENWNKKYIEMSSNGEFITSLRNSWKETFQNETPFNLKVAASTNDEYVHYSSCFMGFDEDDCVLVDGDHLRMVKPKSKENDSYQLIIKTLTDNDFHNLYTNQEEINLALGKYETVVQQLLPKKNQLDEDGLKQLIFGLEGLDRRDEALELLNSNELTQENTNLMGMIGGRHKRTYLFQHLKKEGETAYEYYSKGLNISTDKEDYDQMYYHAINLAFLSLVMNKDEDKMKDFSNKALDAVSNCDDDLWKFATVAEANLYLNNLDISREFYEKAAKMADIRQKISMHTNAYAGYVALKKTTNPEDDFIKFLKTQFLM
jgi:pimeloyl-ACP methyl ester carboxylesterase